MLEVYSVVAHEDTKQASRMMPSIVRRAKFERVIVRGLGVRAQGGVEPPLCTMCAETGSACSAVRSVPPLLSDAASDGT